ncbi:MAG TPA: BTAD domain-containing putative transcriptional regulator [Acetobacteraceae bacterium]|nr:BTAD domain-containing putative transcriptional regulator [Acetobacteraceae bacterium]
MPSLAPDPAGRAAREQPLLRLTLFGRMRAETAGNRSVLPRGRKTRAVLAVLALSPHGTAARSRLAALLWSLRENQQARASLRQAVHELQQALGAAGPRLLRADRHHIALATTGVWIDSTAFTRATAAAPETLDLFAEPLLGDLYGLDPAFDQWVAEQGVRLRQIGRSLGETILAAQTNPAATQQAAERLLRIDPTHQGAWRAVIAAHLAQDDHDTALAAYEQCRATLARDQDRVPSSETEQLAARIRRPLPPPRPSHRARKAPLPGLEGAMRLGVFPLRCFEDANDTLALALMEEITTALAQFRWLTCVPYRAPAGTTPDFDSAKPHLASRLDFLLDGTIQRRGGRVRVFVQLTDLRSGGTVVWARRFDRDVVDIFAVQDEIAAETAAQLDTALLIWEGERARARRLADPDALELMLGAIPSLYRLEHAHFHKAGDLLERSLSLDSASAAAHAWMAYWHLFLVGQGWAPDAAAATRRAAELAERAVALDPGDARALTLAGHVRSFLDKRPEEGSALHERAIALNPNLALAWCFSGLALSYLGDHAEGARRIERARRLAPHDPHGFFFDTAQVMPHLLSGAFEAAVAAGRRAIALNPGFSSAYKGYISALGHLRRDREAADLRRRLLELEPRFSVRDAIVRSPVAREQDMAMYAEGLRLGGVPED